MLFELGEAQQLVDQGLQAFALQLYVADKTLTLGLGQVAFGEQFGGAANGGERAF